MPWRWYQVGVFTCLLNLYDCQSGDGSEVLEFEVIDFDDYKDFLPRTQVSQNQKLSELVRDCQETANRLSYFTLNHDEICSEAKRVSRTWDEA